jgi:3-deoxy-D-manno-octulosonic acid hydroxylase-like protein
MPVEQVTSGGSGIWTAGTPAERVERGDVLYFETAPFPLPRGDDRDFLLRQRQSKFKHKNISYDPSAGRAFGFVRVSPEQAERMTRILADFSDASTAWLAATFPSYATAWKADRVSFRPQEEATRKLRHTARNDLLHVDAFPSRPTQGDRLLRVFANLNPTEPRIWMTSEPFALLLRRYGARAGLPGERGDGLFRKLGQGVARLFRPGRAKRSAYDTFMLRFHDYLKGHDEFQERGAKRLWTFAPNSVWVTMTDACSHAVLRGRYALEHSYFVAPHGLALPNESPAALLAQLCAERRAA